jgi:hypothetical protein
MPQGFSAAQAAGTTGNRALLSERGTGAVIVWRSQLSHKIINRALHRPTQLLEKVLVNSFDLKSVFDPASDIVPDHEFG